MEKRWPLQNLAACSVHTESDWIMSIGQIGLLAARCIVLGVLMYLHPSPLTAQTPATGAIDGRVAGRLSGEYLHGATIAIENTGRVAVSDGQGRFRFRDVPVGRYTLTIRYLGLDPERHEVAVQAGQTAPVEITLASDIFELEAISVEVQVGGQASALNQQRTAPNIRDVASRDALARVRDGQIGEAINALPGVYMNLEILSPTRPIVRGLGDAFNSVTVDGIRLGDQGGGRSTRLRYYPGEIVGQVEVIKAVTPDMEADAIGGTVNLVSRRANELSRRILTVGTGGSYNDIQSNFNRQLNFSYGDRFLNDGRLGVFLTANLYEVSQGYPQLSTSYSVNGEDEYRITAVTANERIENRSRTTNWGLTTDFRAADHTTVSLRGSYLRDARRLEDYRAVYTLGTVESFTPDEGFYRDGRVDLNRRLRYPISGSTVLGAQVEHNFGGTTIDYRGAFSQARNSYDRTFFPIVRATGVDMAYDRTLRDFPAVRFLSDFDQNDGANYQHVEVQRTQAPSVDSEYSADLNIRQTLNAFAGTAYLQAGARLKLRDFEIGDDDAGYYTYAGSQPVSRFLEEFDIGPFMKPAGGRIAFPRINPGIGADSYEALFFQNPGAYIRQDDRSDLLLANRETSFTEDITATYLMGGARLGRMGVLVGARLEHTSFVGIANEIETTGGRVTGTRPVRNSSSYANVLPGIHLTWHQTEDLLLRGSINRTLARPSGRSMQPVRRINDDARTVQDGNPDLSVTTSNNFDLSLEYYIRPLGLLSVGTFYKSIDGFYSSQTETIASGPLAGYDLTTPAMGTGGLIYGIEAGWQQRLDFLPGALEGLGVNLNATLLEADGRYPNRPDERLAFPSTAKRLVNTNLYYARGGMDARLLYNWRDRALTSIGARSAMDRYDDERGTLDLLLSYRFRDRYRVNVDFKNLTNSPIRTYQGSRENPISLRYLGYAVIFGLNLDL